MQKQPLTKHKGVLAWVEEIAKMTKPDSVLWIDGSEKEKADLTAEAMRTGELIRT